MTNQEAIKVLEQMAPISSAARPSMAEQMIAIKMATEALSVQEFEGKVLMDFSDPADVVCRKLIVDKGNLEDALLKLDIGEYQPEGMPVIISVRKK